MFANMADDQNANDATNVIYNCAQNLLNAERLLNENDRENLRNTTSQLNVSCAGNVSNNSPCGCGQRPADCKQPNGIDTNRVACVQEEHRRLFGYRPPAPRARSLKPSNSSSNKRRIVPGRNGQPIAINVKDTWTHSFMCLGNTNDAQMPSCGDSQAFNGWFG